MYSKKNKNARSQFVKLADKEEKKFSAINPTLTNDFNSRYLFWDSISEIFGRSLGIMARLLSFAFSILFFVLLTKMLKESKSTDVIYSSIIKYNKYIIICLVVLEVIISFIYIIPLAILKRVSSLYSAGITLIVFAVLYFLFAEGILIFFVIYDGIINNSDGKLPNVKSLFITSMAIVFVVTIISITSGCILIVKSDDVRREFTIE